VAIVWIAAAGCFGGGEPPPEILSLRHQIFSQERYRELADQWAIYAQAHPGDPYAQVEWGDALRYAGETDAANARYERAFALDSTDARAINAYVQMICTGDADGADWELAHQRLLRAALVAPGNPEIYYNLWMTSMRTGRLDQAAASLRQMVALGDISPPLYDYARNMLAGAPPDAILFTNGDNDTYPPLAQQILNGFRPDVAIVNLSLLNTAWYIRYLRDQGLPIDMTDAEIDLLKRATGNRPAEQMQQHLYQQIAASDWPRALCYAVTVYEPYKILPGRRLLEGLHERVLRIDPAAVASGERLGGGEAELNLERTRELLDAVFRLDSITDPAIDWEREMAVASIGTNYGVLFAKVGEALYAQDPRGNGGAYFARAAALFRFHGNEEWLGKILALWEQLDPENPELPALREPPETS
jgi:hypothetical protein